ncbi:hypothetical protein [Salinigranum sp.]
MFLFVVVAGFVDRELAARGLDDAEQSEDTDDSTGSGLALCVAR